MKDRIKSIRKTVKKTQQDFADSLNVSKSTIEGYEYGRLKVTDRTISDICRIYNIDENWLRSGEGEMFVPKTKEMEIADIAVKLFNNELPPEISALIKVLTEMSESETELFAEVARRWLKEYEDIKKDLPS